MKNAQKYYTFRQNQEYFDLKCCVSKGADMYTPSSAKWCAGRVI